MGSCVSLHKDSHKPLDSKNQNLIIPSPLKHNSFTVNAQNHSASDLAVMPRRSRTRSRADGSKDDSFFDSQPWLESDCEDDFLSVNGDFTPSRGSTPVHHRFSSGNPTVNNPPPVPEPSPKKRLSELFKESLRHQEGRDKEDDTSEESVVVENRASSEKSGNGAEEKSVQCCLPRLRSRRTFATAQVEKV